MKPPKKLKTIGLSALVRAHLSTSDRLGEALCGLVTVLTFTLVAGEQVDDGRKGVVQLLMATAGCCVTWGVIDGVLYVLDAVSQRARRGQLARAVRDDGNVRAFDLLREEVDEFLEELGASADGERVAHSLRASVGRGPIPGLHSVSDDWLGAFAIFSTQILCCIPSILPFLVLDDPRVALRVSNGCAIVLLFSVGFRWAAEVGAHRPTAAIVAALVGGTLVAISVALSG